MFYVCLHVVVRVYERVVRLRISTPTYYFRS